MLAASSTYGCSLEHIWLQAVLLCCGTEKGEARTAGRSGRNAAGGGGGGGGSGAQQRGTNGLAGGGAGWLAPEATAAPGVAFGFVRAARGAAEGHACLSPFLQLQLQCAPGEQLSVRPLPPALAHASTPAPRAMLCPIAARGGRGEASAAELGAFRQWLCGAAGAGDCSQP